MTPDLSARVAALERVVDAIVAWMGGPCAVLEDISWERLNRSVPASAAPPPPAAAPEPDVARGSERVRDYLRRALSDVDQETSIFLVGEALRLLQCAPHPDAEPARTALPDVTWVPVMQQAAARLAPCQPPAAPCADEVEVVARAFGDALSTRVNMRTYMGDVPNSIIRDAMAEALTALSPLRQAERERAWREGAEAQRALMHHLNRHIQRLDEFPLATPELMALNLPEYGK